MGYYIAHSITIVDPGLHERISTAKDRYRSRYDEITREEISERIARIVREMRADPNTPDPDLGDPDGKPDHCLSEITSTHKGSAISLAGVFNYWRGDEVDDFCRRLAAEFKALVLHVEYDMEADHRPRCNAWDGSHYDPPLRKPAEDDDEAELEALRRNGGG